VSRQPTSPRRGARALAAAGLLAVAAAAAPLRAQAPATAGGTGPLDDALAERLADTLSAIARGLDGVMGYAVIDLETGRRVAALADVSFPTASSIKIAILYELARQADEGRIALDEPRPVPPAARVGGSGILQHLTVPALAPRDLATLMIALSDNTATNVLIDLVGREAVNDRMQALHLPNIRLRRKMMDVVAQQQGEQNTATPGELAALLARIHAGDGLSPRARRFVVDALALPKSSPLLRGLPPRVRAATKPGSLPGVRADAGLVLLERRPYALAVMCTYLRDDAEGERAIEAASRAVYAYFERRARAGAYGETLPR
jgi:beta-lactamase class A